MSATLRESLREMTAAAADAAPWLAGAPPAARAGLLTAVADALDVAGDSLVETADAETALGGVRLRGELARTTGQLRFLAAVVEDGGHLGACVDHADPGAVPPRPDLRRTLHPLGPVAVFAAGNFPFAFSVAGGDTASALAAGCPVVVKAHPGHPVLSAEVAGVVSAALAGCGAPQGVFGVVAGFEAGRALVLDPAVRAVGFTGSVGGGRALFDLAASRPDPIPFHGELGSLNPVVVTAAAAQARGDEIARGLVASFTLGVGQFCTKPGLVLVPAGAGLESRVAAAVSEAGAASGRMLTAGIADGFRTGVAGLLEHPEVRVLAGERPDGVDLAAPLLLGAPARTLLTGGSALLEECFGPVTVLVACGSDELDAAVALLPGSLTATVHGEPEEAAGLAPLLARLREKAGRVIWNGWPTGVAVTWAQHHGGPWPATTSPLHTSVGAAAIARWLRPVAYQDMPDELLPDELRERPRHRIPRRVDGIPEG